MTLLTPEFKQIFEKSPLFSQVWNLNPIVLAKLKTADKTFLVLEYSDDSRTAFWYLDEWEERRGLWYSYMPNLEKALPYQLDTNFIPTHLNELIEISDAIRTWLEDRWS